MSVGSATLQNMDGQSDLLQLLGEAPEWHARAACGNLAEAEVFLAARASRRRAIAICRQCPVIVECGEHADANDQRFGIWGGVDRSRGPLHRLVTRITTRLLSPSGRAGEREVEADRRHGRRRRLHRLGRRLS